MTIEACRVYWYVWKVPGKREFRCSHLRPIMGDRMTKHLSERAAVEYCAEMNRQTEEKGNHKREAYAQMEMEFHGTQENE